MKRFISVILLLFMLMAAGCTSSIDEGPDFLTEESQRPDLMGKEFVITSTNAIESVNISGYVSLCYNEGTIEEEWTKVRLSEVADKYNCKLTVNFLDATDESILYTKLFAGADVGNIIFSSSYLIRGAGDAGLLLPIEDYSDYINYRDSDKWGTPNAQEQAMCNGVLCGVIPNLWPNMQPHADYPVMFNEDLMKTKNIENLWEYYETGVWTWDKFLEVVDLCTEITADREIYGMAAYKGHLLRSALMSNGVTAVMQDSDGNYVSGYTTPAALEALNWVIDVYNEENNGFWELANNEVQWGPTLEKFMAGDAAMLIYRQADIYSTIQWDMNFGIIPFAVGPSGDIGTAYGYFENGAVIAMPITAQETEYSARILNDIFEPFESMTNAEDVAKYAGKYIFQNERDIEHLRDMANNSHYSFWVEGGDNVFWSINSMLGSKTASEIIASIKNVETKFITEQVIPMYESYSHYYG